MIRVKYLLLFFVVVAILGVSVEGVDWHFPANCSSITACVSGASSGDTIYLDNGSTTEQVSVSQKVVIDGNNNFSLSGGFSISVDGVVIKNLTVIDGIEFNNYKTGFFASSDNNNLKGVTVENISSSSGFISSCGVFNDYSSIEDVKCKNINSALDVYGFIIGNNNQVINVEISNLDGGSRSNGGNGYDAYVFSVGSFNLISFSSVTDILGGYGSCASGGWEPRGHSGDTILFNISNNNFLLNNTFYSIVSKGSGSDCGDHGTHGNVGSVYLSSVSVGTNNYFYGNNFSSITTPNAATGGGDVPSGAGGILSVFGNSTVLKDNLFSTFSTGNGGGDGRWMYDGRAGGKIYFSCEVGCNFSSNLFSTFSTGNGGNGERASQYDGQDGGDGGVGGSITFELEEDGVFENNIFETFSTGNGGNGDDSMPYGSDGVGGDGGSFFIEIGNNSFFDNNNLTSISAGNGGGEAPDGSTGGDGGSVVGIINDAVSISVSGNVFDDFSGGGGTDPGGDGGYVIGVKFLGSIYNSSGGSVPIWVNGNNYTSFREGSGAVCDGSVFGCAYDIISCTGSDGLNAYGFDVWEVSPSVGGESVSVEDDIFVVEWFTSNTSITRGSMVNFSIYYGNSSGDVNTLVTSGLKSTFCDSVRCVYTWNRSGVYGMKYLRVLSNVSDSSIGVNETSYYSLLLKFLSVDSLSLTPGSAYTSNDLNCSVRVSNPSIFGVLANFSWYKNGELMVSENSVVMNGSSVLDYLNTSKGEEWNCSVTVFAGNDSVSSSSSLTVLNSAPSVPSNLTCWIQDINTSLEWCYQETVNESTSCGGLNTGTIIEDSPCGNPEPVYDGDWATSYTIEAGTNYVDVTYAKPQNVKNTSFWEVKDGEGQTNISIPNNCFEQEVLQFRIILTSSDICYSYCFTGNTKIITKKGEKLIRDLKTDDMILTENGFKSMTVFRERPISDYENKLYEICTLTDCVNATLNHKFWTQIGYVRAKDLRIGDFLKNLEGNTQRIKQINIINITNISVYDIDVENACTYYANGFLVDENGRSDCNPTVTRSFLPLLAGGPTLSHSFSCYNGTGWEVLRTGGGTVYEEGVWWNISETKLQSCSDYNFSLNDNVYFECSGSTDDDGDTLTYFIEQYNSDNFSGSGTSFADELNINYCSGISEVKGSFSFDPDFDNYNISTDTLTEYNVSVYNQSSCTFNTTCVGRCPYELRAQLNSTDSHYNLSLNNVMLTSTSVFSLANITSDGLTFNASLDFLNASSDWLFNLTFTKVFN